MAEQTAKFRPQKALPVLTEQAYQQIAYRDRGSYAQAASYLKKVKAIMDDEGDIEGWATVINAIRNEFKRLPALQDELNKAGL